MSTVEPMGAIKFHHSFLSCLPVSAKIKLVVNALLTMNLSLESRSTMSLVPGALDSVDLADVLCLQANNSPN